MYFCKQGNGIDSLFALKIDCFISVVGYCSSRHKLCIIAGCCTLIKPPVFKLKSVLKQTKNNFYLYCLSIYKYFLEQLWSIHIFILFERKWSRIIWNRLKGICCKTLPSLIPLFGLFAILWIIYIQIYRITYLHF